jgi:multicomponent Na+:H+ antiporter subunit D
LDNTQLIIISSIALPFIASALNLTLHKFENLRDALTLIAAVGTFILVLLVLEDFNEDTLLEFSLLTVMPGLEIAFSY